LQHNRVVSIAKVGDNQAMAASIHQYFVLKLF